MSGSEFTEGLSDSSKAVLQNVLHWSKRRRDGLVKNVDGEVTEYMVASLNDNSYSKADVRDLFQGLGTILKVSIEQASNENANTFVGYVRQILIAADKAGVKIEADIAQAEITPVIRALEQTLAASSTLNASVAPLGAKKMLPSIDQTQALDKANTDVSKLQEANAKLNQKVSQLQSQYSTMMQEKTKIQQELNALKDNKTLEIQLDTLKAEIQKKDAEIEKKDSEVQGKDKELNAKLSDSKQFASLKKMLVQKTQQVKELRSKLNKYEADDTCIEVQDDDSD